MRSVGALLKRWSSSRQTARTRGSVTGASCQVVRTPRRALAPVGELSPVGPPWQSCLMAVERAAPDAGKPVSMPITTARLTLRTHRPGDLEPLRAYYGNPEVARYLPFAPWDDDLARESLQKR